MELTSAQRKIVFGLVVAALAALAVYLIASRGGGSSPPAAAPSRHPAASAAPPAATPAPAAQAPAAGASQDSDIWSLVPFTQQGLVSAETVAVRFGVAYGTYSYAESTSAYVATMKNYISSELGEQIAQAYSVPGVASQRTSQKQVSVATATVTALRAFGPTSLTLIMTVSQRVSATSGGGPTATSYAVTLTGGAQTWQVTDIELASAGQF